MTKLELLRPIKQQVWGWPTLVNFLVGGMASSFYLLKVLNAFLYADANVYSQPATFKLIAPALVILGFLPMAIKVGAPLSGLQLLRNIRGSWISREVLAGIIFVVTALLDWMFPHEILLALSLMAAAALIVSQSFIVYRASAITAWNVPLMPFLNLVSSLAAGCGMVLFMLIFDFFGIKRGMLGITASILALDMIVCLLYLFSSRDETFCRDTEVLRRPLFLLTNLGIARLLPLTVLLVLILAEIALVSRMINLILTSVGLVVITGSAINKFGVLLIAGYSKHLVLDH
jgi:DMSO reductase anchor subunit